MSNIWKFFHSYWPPSKNLSFSQRPIYDFYTISNQSVSSFSPKKPLLNCKKNPLFISQDRRQFMKTELLNNSRLDISSLSDSFGLKLNSTKNYDELTFQLFKKKIIKNYFFIISPTFHKFLFWHFLHYLWGFLSPNTSESSVDLNFFKILRLTQQNLHIFCQKKGPIKFILEQ